VARILLVEDHAPLREQVAALLREAGHQVEEASDGRLALQEALAHPPELVLLDIGLPGQSGLRLCERLRLESAQHVPVLMLTARDQLQDKLAGFAAGGDDYLVKPFAPEELLARVSALVRRPQAGQAYLLRLGPLALDRRTHQAWRDGQPLALAPTPLAILRHLMEAHPRAVTRSALIRLLWNDDAPESDPLRSHIHLLRQGLDKPFEPGSRPLLATVHGVGYRLDIADGSAGDHTTQLQP
jgi:DNA-binding response OmpR family regulator